MTFRHATRPDRESRRPPHRQARPTPQFLESRDLTSVVPAIAAVPPKSMVGPAAVGRLSPVLRPVDESSIRPKMAPVAILFPVFDPGGYTNPCFSTAARTSAH